ncbi:MAG: 50S ribosomal protein L28 [Deltaproteobacteria bacterium]|nr:MAG: 50S ribosomal protein L28 [Deltaproteobacteria bacterium]
MAICFISKKLWLNGNNVSHSNIKTKRHIRSNIQKRRIFDSQSGCFFKIKLSNKGLKILERMNFSKCLKRIQD